MRQRIGLMVILGILLMIRAGGQSLPVACQGNLVRYSVSGLAGSDFEWIVDGGTIERNYNDSVDIRWDGVTGTHQISVIEHTEYGCAGTAVKAVVEVGKATVNLGPDQESCQGKTISLQGPGGYSHYLWSDGSTATSYVGTVSGAVWLEVTDGKGCKARDTVNLSFEAGYRVDLGGDTSLCAGESLVLDIPEGEVLWTIYYNGQMTQGNDHRLVVYPGNQQIIAQVTAPNGCVGIDTLNVSDCSREELLGKIPNAITPDGDNVNDRWKIEKIEDYPNASIRIFDRWGRLVYSREGGYSNDNGWDGTDRNGKPLPVDSYYYVIDLGNGKPGITGFVTIIR